LLDLAEVQGPVRSAPDLAAPDNGAEPRLRVLTTMQVRDRTQAAL
jgi:hypothetical protein